MAGQSPANIGPQDRSNAATSGGDSPSAVSSRGIAHASKPQEYVIRGYSKMVFFWPIAVVSLIFYTAGGGWWVEGADRFSASLGLWWLIAFTLNLLVFTFDFGRANFLTFVTVLGMAILGLIAWDLASDAEVWGGIYRFFGRLDVSMSTNFFLCMFVIFAAFIIVSLTRSRLDYWVIGPNELLHKHGLLGDVRGYSTIHMHVEKEIPDVFEWLLFGSGRLIFKPGGLKGGSGEALVVDHVFRVNRAEKRIKEFLGVLRVDEKED